MVDDLSAIDASELHRPFFFDPLQDRLFELLAYRGRFTSMQGELVQFTWRSGGIRARLPFDMSPPMKLSSEISAASFQLKLTSNKLGRRNEVGNSSSNTDSATQTQSSTDRYNLAYVLQGHLLEPQGSWLSR